jgi:hypothetical protein
MGKAEMLSGAPSQRSLSKLTVPERLSETYDQLPFNLTISLGSRAGHNVAALNNVADCTCPISDFRKEELQLEYIFDYPWELGVVLAVVLALALDVGRRVAVRFQIEQTVPRKEQMGTIRDGFFVLLSLLLGFTLALAASRFAERRSLLIEEAISIGTTYLRTSTLPLPYRDHSKQLLKEYVDSCIELNNAGTDQGQLEKALQHSKRIQSELWSDAAAVAQNDRTAITAAYINSLNETIDLHEKRVASFENRVPQPVWIMILCVALIAAFSRGSTLTSRFWLTLILIPITIAIVVALIADLDAPSRGLIRLDQRAMQRLKADMSGEHGN